MPENRGASDVAYDLVIRNGTVVDGSGGAPYRADVGVRHGRIAAIGRIRERGVEEIDAEGHVVTPGFIDGHTHMDAQVFWDPLGTCSCWHGVTTWSWATAGSRWRRPGPPSATWSCATSSGPRTSPAAAMAAGIDWTWETFPEYLDAVDRPPKGINYAANIGHSALRTWAMGERAFDRRRRRGRPARDGARAARRRCGPAPSASPRRAARTTRPPTTGRSPPVWPTWDEVRRLVGVLGDLGAGMFEIAQEPAARARTPRSGPSSSAAWSAWPSRPACRSPSACCPPRSDGHDWRGQLELIDRASAAGGRMYRPGPLPGVLGAAVVQDPAALRRAARVARGAGPAARRAGAAPCATRPCAASSSTRPTHGDYGRAIGAETRKPDYRWLRILDEPLPPNPTVAEVAAAGGHGSRRG